jgi:hypothetical protein
MNSNLIFIWGKESLWIFNGNSFKYFYINISLIFTGYLISSNIQWLITFTQLPQWLILEISMRLDNVYQEINRSTVQHGTKVYSRYHKRMYWSCRQSLASYSAIIELTVSTSWWPDLRPSNSLTWLKYLISIKRPDISKGGQSSDLPSFRYRYRSSDCIGRSFSWILIH